MPSSNQWLSLVAVIWLQSINGTNSNFPAYSSQLKTLLSISQFQLNNLAFASDAGKLFGCVSGFAALHLPLWLVLFIGSYLGFTGYGVQFLFASNQISSLSYWQVFFLTVLAGNSICWINTVCYIIIIKNFPHDHQVAVGLTTSYSGLSAKIYTSIVDLTSSYFSMERAKSYLLFNAILPLGVSIAASPFVRDVAVESKSISRGGFIAIFTITVVTGVFAVSSSLWSSSGRIFWWSNAIVTVVFLLIPLAIPLSIAIKGMAVKWKFSREGRVCDFNMQENGGVEGRTESEAKETEDDQRKVHQVSVMEEIGVKTMIRRVEFWLYFFVYLSGATLGLVYLNNLGQIAESRGCLKTSSLVSLSSSFGFFGRLVPSLLDYFFSRSRYTLSRPAFIAAVMAPMVGAFFLLLNRTDTALFFCTAVIGVSTGAITATAVSLTTELFGSKNFGVNHNVIVTNIPVGSFVFGYFASLVYRKEANGREKCMGTGCYGETFLAWGGLCLLGTSCALILYFRTRNFYSRGLR